MKMEGSVKSGVLKKKSSSGCLILKKKNPGGEFGVLGDSSKDKKRARLVASSSSSSDEDESLEFMRRKVNEKRLKNGSMGYKRSEIENGDIEVGAERKRSTLDLFEFDEYDEFDGKKMRNEFFKIGGRNAKECGVSSDRNFMVDKRKKGSDFVGSSSGRSKGYTVDDDEADMPISLLKLKYQERGGESIRLQGKNGVLKVLVNKKKNMEFQSKHKNCDPKEVKERKRLKSDDIVKKDLLSQVPASKKPENRGLLVDKERSAEKERRETNFEKVKLSSSKGGKGRDSEIDGTENVTPIKGKEVNAKQGGSTEKQMLREKIRVMLVDAGWTIDYRPRRNRDYLDAVYISPSGTAYWSIVKAYDAFKTQLGEDNGEVKENVGSSSVAPLSEDLINKLTRQTKKKIAEEMRRKRKEDNSAKKSAVREASDSDGSEERLSSYMKQNQKLRGKLCKVDQDSDDDLSDDPAERKLKKVKVEKSYNASKSSVIQGRTGKVIGRCTLLVRGENSDCDGYVPYSGKRTVLAWLIDSGMAKLSEKVQYMNRRRTRVMLEGWITRDGIHCGCCSKILTVSKFELHAGSKLRQPFQNIFLESGLSLLQCQIDAWNSQEESLCQDFFTVGVDGDDPDDDTCGVCGDGGDLICCDSCPSTFHQICLEIKMLPSGDWHCPNCTCKFCGCASGDVTEGNNDTGCELNKCNFCEKKYHRSCSERVHALPISSNGASFCGIKCQEIYDHLQKILGIKHELEGGISWSLIRRTDVSDASQRGFPVNVECNSKLAVALAVMDECFLPIIDRRSGINMIHNVVYNCGSNFNRLNYSGFYMVILERGDEIISAASIRFHGDRLAEMPFIATRDIYRRQGMCRHFLSAIEAELSSLNVGQLIIPAISEHTSTWTTVFNFHELEDVHKKEIKSMNMLVFPGTDMLQKQLVKQENSDGVRVSESTSGLPELPVSVEKSDVNSSLERNRQASGNSGEFPESKTYDETDALASGPPVPAVPSNDLLDSDNTAPSASDAICESNIHLTDQGVAAFKPEVENKQNVPSSYSKCSPPADNNNSSEKEHGLLEPPVKDSSSSVEAAVEDACKIEAPCLKSIPSASGETLNAAGATGIQSGIAVESSQLEPARVNLSCSMKGLEDAETPKIISNGCVESSPTHLVNEELQEHHNRELNHTTLHVMGSELHSSIEPSPDSAAATDAKLDVGGCILKSPTSNSIDDNTRRDGIASCSEENVEATGAQLTPIGASFEVSADTAFGTTGKNQKSAPSSSLPNDKEINKASNCDLSHKAPLEVKSDDTASETDEPGAGNGMPCVVIGNANSSCETIAQNAATIENSVELLCCNSTECFIPESLEMPPKM